MFVINQLTKNLKFIRENIEWHRPNEIFRQNNLITDQKICCKLNIRF